MNEVLVLRRPRPPAIVPPLLSFTAGFIDSFTVLAPFGLFVAQVTGSSLAALSDAFRALPMVAVPRIRPRCHRFVWLPLVSGGFRAYTLPPAYRTLTHSGMLTHGGEEADGGLCARGPRRAWKRAHEVLGCRLAVVRPRGHRARCQELRDPVSQRAGGPALHHQQRARTRRVPPGSARRSRTGRPWPRSCSRTPQD